MAAYTGEGIMYPFREVCPEVAKDELRYATVPEGASLTPGAHVCDECYCLDPACDCRRLLINIATVDRVPSRTFATISYAWADPDYRGRPREEECFLDPGQPQSVEAEAWLDLSREVLLTPDYVERLKRHYRLFKEARVAKRRAGLVPLPPKRGRRHGKSRRRR